jgi:hypothetical protein
MRRATVLASILAVAASLHKFGSASEVDKAAACRQLLHRTLTTMEARPALKEEFATGLMWLRLDALEALEAGDPEGCLERALRVAALLGVDGRKG